MPLSPWRRRSGAIPRSISPEETVMDEIRNCRRCQGEGTIFYPGFTSLEGMVYPDQTKPCYACQGQKVFTAPNEEKIIETITTARGATPGKRRLRIAWPGSKHYSDHEVARAYYVWRLARFHGGVD